jgi:hypothetical protein
VLQWVNEFATSVRHELHHSPRDLRCGSCLTASYGELQPAIGIHLLDFDLFTDPAHQWKVAAKANPPCWNGN